MIQFTYQLTNTDNTHNEVTRTTTLRTIALRRDALGSSSGAWVSAGTEALQGLVVGAEVGAWLCMYKTLFHGQNI